jgi:putative tryptophan/tyrosine transport system substrate-binding protein
MIFAASDPEAQVRVTSFEQGLKVLGWVRGNNIRIDYRFAAGDVDRMRTFAKELVFLQPDLIVVHALTAVAAIRQHTREIPIVFTMVTDPVGVGMLKSLSHTEDNITGFTTFEYSIVGKWLELLKGIAPAVMRVGLVFDPDAAYLGGAYWLREFETTARTLAVEPIAIPIHHVTEMQNVLAELGRESGSGLLVATDVFTSSHHAHIVALATQYRLPGCYAFRYFATGGGLMSYGPNGASVFRQTASYVDRILKGANPGDLPVQQPNVFELIINLKTANALGLKVPLWLLARANEVIE